MSYKVVRASSPPSIRVDDHRPSVSLSGPTVYSTGLGPQPRASFSTMSAARADAHRNSVYETVPVSKSTYQDAARGSNVTRTEYSIKPRRDSAAADTRRPLTAVTQNLSPIRDYPRRSESPTSYNAPRDSSRLLQPRSYHPSSSQKRATSTSRVESDPRYGVAAPSASSDSIRDARRSDRRDGPYLIKVAEPKSSSLRASDNDLVLYSNSRDQSDRDYAGSRPQRRESNSRRERQLRPAPALEPEYTSRDVPGRQSMQMTSRPRRLERIESEKLLDLQPGFDSEPDRSSRHRHKSRASLEVPVLHQDSGYTSNREERKERRRSHASSRPDEALAVVAASHYRDDNRDEVREKSYRKHAHDERSDRDRYDRRPSEYDRAPHRERHPERKDRRYSSYDQDTSRQYDERHSHEDRGERAHGRSKESGRERDRNNTGPRDHEYDRRHGRTDDDRRHDSSRKIRSRDSSPEHTDTKKVAAATALGGLAAAGIATASRSHQDRNESESDTRHGRHRRRRKSHQGGESAQEDVRESDGESDRKHRRRRRRDRDGDDVQEDVGDRHRRDQSSSASDTPPDRQRPRSRVRNRYSDDTDYDRYVQHGRDESPEREQLALPAPPAGPSRNSPSRHHDDESDVRHSSRDLDDGPESGGPVYPGDEEDDRPRRVQLVEPAKKEVVVPKSILKKPRELFPEDPQPTREGVAPHKSTNKVVPLDKRWTRISRMIVNPEALEKAHERFETRDDYVIVLRVLSEDEVKKLAKLTSEIREIREREYLEQKAARRAQRREQRDRDGYDRASGPSDTENDQPLRIEGPPPQQAAPVDFRQLDHPQQQHNLAQNINHAQPRHVSDHLQAPSTHNGGSATSSAHELVPTPEQLRIEQREREQQEQMDKEKNQEPVPVFDTSRYSQEV